MDCYLRLKQVVHPIHLNVNIEIPIQNAQEEQSKMLVSLRCVGGCGT